MSFSNQQSRVKNQIAELCKLGLCGQVRNIAEDRFVTVDTCLGVLATAELGLA